MAEKTSEEVLARLAEMGDFPDFSDDEIRAAILADKAIYDKHRVAFFEYAAGKPRRVAPEEGAPVPDKSIADIARDGDIVEYNRQREKLTGIPPARKKTTL